MISKKFLLIIIAAIVLLSVVAVLVSIYSKKDVSFKFASSDFTVKIYNKNGETINELTSSGVVPLSRGEYSYSVVGEKYNPKVTPFSVKSAMEITVSPIFLESYISTLSEQEESKIASIIRSSHPSVENIKITDLTISQTGEWAYGKLTVNNSTSDIYRFVMKKKDTAWTIAAGPAIALSKKDAPDIPEAILYSLY